MKKIIPISIWMLSTLFAAAQSSDEENNANITISHAARSFRFERGDEAHPVVIKETSSRQYLCNNYNTYFPVVEFYNDVEKIDEVSILVDNSKKHGITPKHEYYSVNDIFYSDARICYFKLPFAKKGATGKVTFEKTTLDPHYFTSIYLAGSEAVAEMELKIFIPSWMKAELKDLNCEKFDIKKNAVPEKDGIMYTYMVKNMPAIPRESSSPGITYYAPHIMVMNKYAEPAGIKYTYFNTLKDQYNWYHKLIKETENDPQVMKAKAEEVTKGLVTDDAKVKAVFQWVQDNIRYIAFEDGIAGFKPDKAQNVLQKKYGDCKGMANLVTEMLRSINLDARRCWIGTRHLFYDYSTPSLAVDNHMISVWMNKGVPVYLDATEKYIGFGEVAERIQGRQTLIEDGANFILNKVPVADYQQNTSIEQRKLTLEGGVLKGRIVQTWKGENKEMLLSGLNSIRQDKQENALSNYLSRGRKDFEISALKVVNLSDYNKDINVEYDILWKNAVADFNQETYLEVDNRRNFDGYKIDTSKRKLPYWFYFKDHVVFETEVVLPADKKVESLPPAIRIQQPGYSFTGSYTSSGSKLNYRCEIILKEAQLKPDQFSQWNNDIEKLKGFYNQQVVLTKVK
ncbi:transglutaminase domain-containing protein [Terrimonas sp. NA20]|uniref:Transglutaminase domain-containing protein n=1 Tax=Terrimonas ginsenosidimutans TaxID=2908004 RepID=A0ABS9KX09_9BACT|nr:transglutaminase domain-containing protein [Terrimonas ginsenosidimutans]MCG2616828.1 transglutaminase domain-containing protein [Terrimonas ginsenosidimutans]